MPAPCNQNARYSFAFVATCSRSMLCACPMALAMASACFVSFLMPALYPSRWYEFKAGFGCQAGTHPGPTGHPSEEGMVFYLLLGGVPRSGGVGLVVVTCPEPTPAFGHPSREGMGGGAGKRAARPAKKSGPFLSPPWRGAATRRGGSGRTGVPGTHPGLRPPLPRGDGRRGHLG